MIRKLIAGKRMLDVVTPDEYRQAHKVYDENSYGIIRGDYVYPIRKPNDDRFGAYVGTEDDVVGFFRGAPSEEYHKDHIIDFSNISNIQELIQTETDLASAENALLSDVDEVFKPTFLPDDSPEARLLKEAVEAKQIDISRYEHRFGNRYNNDKRIFKKPDITLTKLRSICNALDIKASLTLEDAPGNIANPMHKVFTTEITSIENDEEE